MSPEDQAPDPTRAEQPTETEPEKNPYPPEHAHLHDWVKEAEERLRQLDEELNRTNAAPRPALRPTWAAAEPVRPVTRSPTDIQQEKETLKANTYQRVEKETQRASPQLRQASRDIAFKQLYKEDIAKLLPVRKSLPQPAAQWNINTTQVKIMAYAQQARETQPTTAAQPSRMEAAPPTQTPPRPDWTAAERPAEAPPAAAATAQPGPEVDISASPPVEFDAPTETTVEPEVADVDIPDLEPEL